MAGEMDLNKLVATMSPQLRPELYVFCTVAGARYGDFAEADPIATFQEAEGLTLVLEQARADLLGLAYEGTFNCITLLVHSSLEAVGLTAVIATTLTQHNISANVIAGYYHDHVFVPSERAAEATAVLTQLTHQNERNAP